jgi:hypothetical protein
LDLDHLSFLQCGSGLLGVGLERGVRGDIGARRNGGAMTDALENLLALVDLANLFSEQSITTLTEFNDAGIRLDPSYT